MKPAALFAHAHLPHRLQKSANASSASDRRLMSAAAFLGMVGNFAKSDKFPCSERISRIGPTNVSAHRSAFWNSGRVARKAKNNSDICYFPTRPDGNHGTPVYKSVERKCRSKLNNLRLFMRNALFMFSLAPTVGAA